MVQYSNPIFPLKWQLCGIRIIPIYPCLDKPFFNQNPVSNTSTRHSSSWMDAIVPLSSSVVGFTAVCFVQKPSHIQRFTVFACCVQTTNSRFELNSIRGKPMKNMTSRIAARSPRSHRFSIKSWSFSSHHIYHHPGVTLSPKKWTCQFGRKDVSSNVAQEFFEHLFLDGL